MVSWRRIVSHLHPTSHRATNTFPLLPVAAIKESEMKLDPRNLGRLVLFVIVVGFVLGIGYIGENPRAQEKTVSPARTGYVNDFAGVLDDKTRQRLETVLDNVRKRSGIELDLATVQNTGGQDIFTFSRQLAGDWDLGGRRSTKKSLLLVVSVDDKAVFTQYSKSVQ